MKELSIEEKAKAYDEAIKKAESLYKVAEPMSGCNVIIETLFPELKESEDERIRKVLRERIIRYDPNNEILIKEEGISQKQFISWLEKQGEQKPTDKVEPKFHEGEWVVTDKNNVVQIKAIEDSKYVLENTMSFTVDYVDKCWRKWTILDAKEGDVLSYRDGQWCFIYKGIVTEDTFKYYALLSEKGITVNDAAFSLLASCIIPATKEQRDLLFQKMKEAGYMWDEKKLELKIEEKPVEKFYSNGLEEEIEVWVGEKAFPEGTKITPLPEAIKIVRETALHFQKWEAARHIDGRSQKEQLEAKQDLTWSEEDECIMNAIFKFLDGSDALSVDQQQAKYWTKSIKDRVQPQPKQEWSEEDYLQLEAAIDIVANSGHTCTSDWLKSLRPQNTWKPSKRQKEALLWCVVHLGGADKQVLGELLEELNKL